MQIVNLRDKNGSQVTPKTHIDSVYTSDGISLGSKLVPNASGVAVTGNISATTFVGNLQGTADNASKTTGTLTLNVNGSNYTFNGSSNQTVTITAEAGSNLVQSSSSSGTRYLVGASNTSSSGLTQVYSNSNIYFIGSSLYAGTFVGSLSGNASTATTASTASRTSGTLTLNVNGSSYSFDGSSNKSVTINTSSSSSNLSISTNNTVYLVGTSSYSTSSASTLYRYSSSSSCPRIVSGSLYATAFYAESARKLKENIKSSEVNALDVINQTQIYDFNYKSDEEKKPKIGIIADEAPDLLTSPKKDGLDFANAIGLLLSAVQSLSRRLDRLEIEMESV